MSDLERCVVYVGRKFFVRYVLAMLFELNVLGCEEVRVEAMGRSVHRAVMIVNSARELLGDLKIKNVLIGSVTLTSRDPTLRRKSKITIVVGR